MIANIHVNYCSGFDLSELKKSSALPYDLLSLLSSLISNTIFFSLLEEMKLLFQAITFPPAIASVLSVLSIEEMNRTG